MRTSGTRAAAAAITLAAALWHPSQSRAEGPTPPDLQRQNDALRQRLDDMQRQIDALRSPATPVPVTPLTPVAVAPLPVAPLPGGPPATFQSVFVDHAPVPLPGGVTAGYKDGFYLKQADGFSLTANGVFDVRYSYTDVRNKTGLTGSAVGGADGQRSLSGFGLFNGNLSLGGELFRHDKSAAFFKATGNFGTFQTPAGTPGGTFILDELYAGYQFDDRLKVRAGAMIVPLTPFTGLTLNGGLTFPNVADALIPFLTGFGVGADVGGSLLDSTVSYDVVVTNGTTGQQLTNSTSVLTGRGNRVAVYTREQVCGSGKLSDFLDESDTQDHQQFVWVVGGGFGYESQNDASANAAGENAAFPGPQGTLRLQGASSAGVGFRPTTAITGDAYRYVLDVRGKYRGFSFVCEGDYQNFANENDAPIIPGFAGHSIGQTAFTAQAGYFVIPHKLEVAGRFAELYTNGLRHVFDDYTFGVNYYVHGENLKLQLAETYVPRQAGLTSNTGLIQNTQDWLTQVQVQLKF